MEELLNKKERRFLKRQQKQESREKGKRSRKMKKTINIALIGLVLGGGIFGGSWFLTTRPATSESEIITKQGIHWHPELSIKILGKYQEIPANIGLGITERSIHTHDTDGIIHLEFSGLVKEDGIKLGKFFEIWGKEFNKDCIFDYCNRPEGQLKMLINGEMNSEFENYLMQDKDKIEIIFE